MDKTSRRTFLAFAGSVGVGLLVQRDGVHAGTHRPGDLAAVEARLAAQRAELCSGKNAAGVGLRGEYFASEGCAGAPLLVRLDTAIDFDATLDWPGERRDARPRSVRWSGWVKPPIAGRYRFHAGVSAARIVVARQSLAGPDAPAQADIELAAGRFYPIAMEVDRVAAVDSRIRLEWTAPHGARFAVPRALLYLPTEGLVASPLAARSS